MHQVMHSRSSSNGYNSRKVQRDDLPISDNKFQPVKINSSRPSFGKLGEVESSSSDRLTYLTTCLLGHQVDVHLVDGSLYSGIFHTINSENFGIILKKAHLIKDVSGGQSNVSEPPSETLVILPEDFAQMIAKGVPLTKDELTNEVQHEKHQELMTDSRISLSRRAELGRELERWIPDENDPGCPELENTFDAPWNRGWDQFETNATLFGVKSTFREELYTTELPRGPHMRELERRAELIAREIASEDALDLHQAEERGRQLEGRHDIDEETRFSAVHRGTDDSGYHEVEDILMDSRNDETFGGISSSSTSKPPVDFSTGKTTDGTQVPSKYSSKGANRSSLPATSKGVQSGSEDYERQPITEQSIKQASMVETSRVSDDQFSEHAGISCSKEDKEKKLMLDQNRATKAEVSDASSKNQEKVSTSKELSDGALPPKTQGTTVSLVRPSSSASSTSDRGGVTSTSAGRGLSSSSSSGSLSSEKSTLNPHAKEFKLNPNAKSFVPTLRPSSPAADSSFYYPANVPSMAQMHGMPVGMGPVLFNPQAPPMPHPYYHPNGPQYGQQMIMGQPRPFMYMPPYPSEMQYKGREF